MIQLTPFTEKDFARFITWVDDKELLITIAGNYFSYPLNAEQLHAYLNDGNSHSFNIVDTDLNNIIGHAELYKTGNDIYKIDKLIIGNAASRGKGFCLPVMKALTVYAFDRLHATTVELNVFDWNTSAIKCYEISGFAINENKTALYEVDGKKWTALNMVIENAAN